MLPSLWFTTYLPALVSGFARPRNRTSVKSQAPFDLPFRTLVPCLAANLCLTQRAWLCRRIAPDSHSHCAVAPRRFTRCYGYHLPLFHSFSCLYDWACLSVRFIAFRTI